MSNERLIFDNGADKRSPVSTDNPLPVNLMDGDSGEPLSFGFSPGLPLTDASGKLYKPGPGMIGDIQCFKSGTGNSVVVYDGIDSSGTVLATIEGATVGMRFCELWKFTVGLYVAQSGGTPGTFIPSVR